MSAARLAGQKMVSAWAVAYEGPIVIGWQFSPPDRVNLFIGQSDSLDPEPVPNSHTLHQ